MLFKNKIWGVLIVLLISGSCADRTPDGRFKISGELKNISDQKIYLEEIFFSDKNPEILDTALVQDGRFELNGISREEGLYQMRFEKDKSGFIFINDQPHITISADVKNTDFASIKFNSPANIKLIKFLQDISSRGEEMQNLSARLKSAEVAANDSLARIAQEKLQQLDINFKKFIVNFIDTSSQPLVSLFAFGYTRDIEPEKIKPLVSGLSSRFPQHKAVVAFVARYNDFVAQQSKPVQASPAGVPIGSIAPDFTMNDVNDKPFSLNQLRGKYVLIDFWASWCGPCRGENPNLVSAYNKFKDKNFTILGVSLDDKKSSWLKAIQDDGLVWQQVSDLKGWSSAASGLYGFNAIPQNVLIDPDGKIVANTLRGEALHLKLVEILK